MNTKRGNVWILKKLKENKQTKMNNVLCTKKKLLEQSNILPNRYINVL